MDDSFARSGDATGAIKIGMLRYALGTSNDCRMERLCSARIALRNVAVNRIEIAYRAFQPDKFQSWTPVFSKTL